MKLISTLSLIQVVSSLSESITFTAERSRFSSPKDAFRASLKRLEKYGLFYQSPEEQGKEFAAISSSSTLTKAISSSSTLTNVDNYLYGANFTMGNNQTFFLQLDTGSSDVWVRGRSCQDDGDSSCSGAETKLGFNTVDSTVTRYNSSWGTAVPFAIIYGAGSIVGNCYRGPVAIGNASVTIPFGVSVWESGDAGIDGLVGFAGNSISSIASAVNSSANFFDAMNFTGSSNVFSFFLSNSGGAKTAEVTLGGIDTTKYTGTISYINIDLQAQYPYINNSLTWWAFSLSGSTVSIAGTSFPLTSDYCADGISDTGTSLIILTTAAADGINKAIGGTYSSTSGVYTISCDVLTTGASITFKIGTATFVIPPSVYVFNDGSGNCFSGITQGADSASVVILGDVFLRMAYSVYDKSTSPPRVGFATSINSVTSSALSHSYRPDKNLSLLLLTLITSVLLL